MGGLRWASRGDCRGGQYPRNNRILPFSYAAILYQNPRPPDRPGRGPSIPTAGGVPRALVSRAAAQAILHECLAVGALQALAPGVRAAALHLLLLHAALRGGRAGLTRGRGSGAGGGGRALLGQAALHEGPALGALQSLGCRVRVAARHPLLLAVLVRSLGDGLSGPDRECRTHRHQPCRVSHIDSFREQETQIS